jgi:F0F1-type ATP synthase membrane subunit b/b'
LKLHIECVQDKLDDSEKARDKLKKEKVMAEEELSKDTLRYKDLLSLREKEVEQLKQEYKRVLMANEDLKREVEQLQRDQKSFLQKGAQSVTNQALMSKEMPLRSATVMGNKTIHEKSSSS